MKTLLIIIAVIIVVALLVYLYMIANAMRAGQFNVNTNTIGNYAKETTATGSTTVSEVEKTTEAVAMTDSSENTSAATKKVEYKKAQFAGGCFWCVEADYEKVPGVIDVVSGYAGGTNEDPTYENYAAYGHREVVEVTYDPSMVSYEDLVEYLIRHADVTDPDGSFYDRGYEYSPAIFYSNETEKEIAGSVVEKFNEMEVYDKPIVAPIEPTAKFWSAEEYHQDYYKKNPIRYTYYRNGSGRDRFISKYWDDQPPQIIGNDSLAEQIARVDMLNKKWEDFEKPDADTLKSQLTDMQYKVTQKEGTEPPFQNEYFDNKEEGLYVDVVSGEPLFSSRDKFDSGTGWPSFTKPISPNVVTEHQDYKLILPRTEIRSKYADSHLGHVFNDAPKELGGIRYCMNSASLRFIPKDNMEEAGYGDYLFLFE